MFESYIIYILILIISVYLANIAQKYNSKTIANCISLLLIFIAGCRGIGVGIDTATYDKIWEESLISRPKYIEIGFQLLFYILQIFSSDSIIFFIACSAIIYGLTISRLWDYRSISSFPVAIAVFYMVNFMPSMNIMRQYCGVAIVFYFFKYLLEGKTLKYLLGVTLATLMHYSSIIALAFLFIRVFIKWKEMSKKEKVMWITLTFLLPLICIILLHSVISEYGQYFESHENNPGILTISKILFIIISFYISMLRKKTLTNDNIYIDNKKMLLLKMSFIAYLIGTTLESLGYFFTFMSRIGMCFYVFGALYWGILFKCTRNRFTRSVYLLALIGLVVLPFIISMMYNGQGTIPYSFIWS